MSDLNEFLAAISTVLFGAIAYLLKRGFDRFDRLEEKVDKIGQRLDESIADASDTRARLDVVWADYIAPAKSPRQLNERGQRILVESGIREIVDERTEELLSEVRKGDVSNPYDAQKTVLATVDRLGDDQSIVEKLKLGAFNTGSDIQTVLFVGGLYLRNKIFPELGFTLEVPSTDGEDVPATAEPSQPEATEPTDPANP